MEITPETLRPYCSHNRSFPSCIGNESMASVRRRLRVYEFIGRARLAASRLPWGASSIQTRTHIESVDPTEHADVTNANKVLHGACVHKRGEG